MRCFKYLSLALIIFMIPPYYAGDKADLVKKIISCEEELQASKALLREYMDKLKEFNNTMYQASFALLTMYKNQVKASDHKDQASIEGYKIMQSSYLKKNANKFKEIHESHQEISALADEKRRDIKKLEVQKKRYEKQLLKLQKSQGRAYHINTDKKIELLAKKSTNIKELMINLQMEFAIGDLSNIPDNGQVSEPFLVPAAGTVSLENQGFIISSYPHSNLFSINNGIAVLSTQTDKYGTIIVMYHDADYKSIIFGDYKTHVKTGEVLYIGDPIGTATDPASHRPQIFVTVYHKDAPIFSTKAVDNFVEKLSS